MVVASFGSAGIAAYDFQGQRRWKADLGKQTHEWGQGSSPILHGELVIVYHGPGPFSALYALDKRTGATKWSVPLKEKQPAQRFDGFAGQGDGALGTFSTPLVVRAGGRDEIVLPVANKVRAFAPATGRELWTVDGMNPLVYSSASFGEGTLVAMGGFFGAMIFMKPGGDGDMTPKRLVFEQRMKKHTIGSPMVKDGHVYVCVTDGFGQCYELATGRLVWEERLPSTGANAQTWGSAVLVGDVLYVVNQSGDTLLLRAAPKFELMGSNSVGELSNSTLAFSNREIFLRTHAALYCIAEPLERAGR
jgi:outer membrane protein assembly factor BamB